LEPVNFKKGEAIIKEGDNGEEFYIIEKGKCEVLKLHERNGK
jgi:CRP-like cAMP-binding protein